MKRAFLIAAAILMAAGLIIIWAVLIFSDSGTWSTWRLSSDKTETLSYPISEDFSRIEILTKESDVTFLPAEDGAAKAVCVETEKNRHTVTVENGTLKISANGHNRLFGRSWFFSESSSVKVYLPSKEYEALTVDSTSGDITVNGDITVSSTDISTRSGDVRLGGVKAKKINCKVTTGDITFDRVECAGTVSVYVTTGDVKASDTTFGSLRTTGSTGDVRLTDTVASGRIIIERSTGDVRFENADGGEISVKTSTGDVTGTLRTGKNFSAHTSVGSVSVPDSSSGGKCEIATSTGDIDIRVR